MYKVYSILVVNEIVLFPLKRLYVPFWPERLISNGKRIISSPFHAVLDILDEAAGLLAFLEEVVALFFP